MKSATSVWRQQQENYRHLGQVGKVISKTRIIEAPAGFTGPYWVVMVQLKQERTVGQWADEAEPKLGMKIVGVLRRTAEADKAGVIEYGVKWKKL